MRILVTGAAGFFGRHLCRHLQAAGEEVVGTGLGGEIAPPGVPLHTLDVRDAAAVAAVIHRVSPDAVLHLAALSHVGDSWRRPDAYFQANVLGAEQVFAAAGRARVLFVSSAEVYGVVPDDEQPIDDDRPLAPRSPYALTKASAERLAVAGGAVVARCFNLLGPGQAPNFALPSFAAQLAAIARGDREPVLRVGNLAARRDYVHVDDASEALRLLLAHGEPATTYNVASGEAHSIEELLERLRRLSGLDVRVESDPSLLRPIDTPLLCGRASRLTQLGWSPRRSIDAALAELWAEARERG